MTSPRTARLFAVGGLVLIWALVCGGLAWATSSVLQLERREADEAAKAAGDETRQLVLSRLDGLVAPILYRESARKYEEYRYEYKPAHAARVSDHVDVSDSVLVPSPLQDATGAEWILLHFMVSRREDQWETNVWSSPQVPSFDRSIVSAVAMPAAERKSLAGPANWLAALRDTHTLSSLLSDLESATGAHLTRRLTVSRDEIDKAALPPGGNRTIAPIGVAEPPFSERVERLLQVYPPDQCISEHVALDNLDIGPDAAIASVDESGCVGVTCTPMEPVWIDLTLDGQPHLAFVRSVTVASVSFCTLQGVLVDWPRLRDTLEAAARASLPQGRMEPVQPNDRLTRLEHDYLMTSLPARLDPGNLEPAAASSGLRVGFLVAWLATIAALIAISYGTLRYLGLVERRMRFVAAVTHELRTPLTTFQLHTDLLADKVRDQGEREHVETLRSESKRLARLVENVLAYSRMGSAGPTLNRRPIPIDAMLSTARAETSARCEAAEKRLVVENRCPPGTCVNTDAHFVTQILGNLIDNACKYSPAAPDPAIWLGAAVDSDGAVVIDVEDGGGGVAPQQRREVFRPFHRARQNDAGGMGLGLALSRYWAECLGGKLGLGRGRRDQSRFRRFILTLPSEATRPPAHN